ncbi:MAG: 16S rRNA (cytosine(1402)-N(4))-methyltransferase [Rickettsiales bacterium]|nr:16S rRNA (cytosine(1402)-N(4))-methyltransferase [Rickettsiales bacterium]
MQVAAPHNPVMLQEMLAAMQPADGQTYIDATFGAGGYSRALLESAKCKVFAIDRDPNTIMLADALARDFPGQFFLLSGSFSDMVSLAQAQGVESVDGIVLDIGVSSMQLDEAERGFSFKQDGPLDMRMSQQGMTAADVVNTMEESALADILYNYGEERASRRIAKAIVRARSEAPIERTGQLAEIVRKAIGHRPGATDPATKTFQALRIHVNAELDELTQALEAAEQLLSPGGRLVVVVFHSLEDRLVKRFLFERSHGEPLRGTSRHLPDALMAQPTGDVAPATFLVPKGQPVKPTKKEVETNSRARSAKLRFAIRKPANDTSHGEDE